MKMCCRYWLDENPEIWEIIDEMYRSPLVKRWQGKAEIVTSGEIFPTNVVPVIAPDKNGNRAVYPMKWGFSGRSLLMNARAETAAVRPMFKDAWAKNRCIVPASGYFEWEHRSGAVSQKYMIRPKGSEMTWLSGLYRIEEGLPVFVILTREPAEEIRFIHDRMPLIMPEQQIDEWIRPDSRPEKLLPEALTEMIFDAQPPSAP